MELTVEELMAKLRLEDPVASVVICGMCKACGAEIVHSAEEVETGDGLDGNEVLLTTEPIVDPLPDNG